MPPTVNSPDSELLGTGLKMTTPCGKGNFVHYPAALALEGMQGRFLWFLISCECGTAYLTSRTQGPCAREVSRRARPNRAQYEDLPGEELVFNDGNGPFFCKNDSEAAG